MQRRAFTVVVLALLSAATFSAAGQDEPTKKFTPRLPPYYAALVTPSQRKEIYALQERYAAEMAALKAKLEELKTQLDEISRRRDDEIEAVLTPLQRKQLQAARDAAAAKRRKAR